MQTENAECKSNLPDIRKTLKEHAEEDKEKVESLKQKKKEVSEEEQRILDLTEDYEIFYTNTHGNKVINTNNLGKMIAQGLNLYPVYIVSDDDVGKPNILVWDDEKKHYVTHGIAEIGKQAQKIMDLNNYTGLKNNHVNEVIGVIKRLGYKTINDLEPHPDLLNLKNGVFNTKTRELEPHSPKYIFTSEMPIQYNPDAKCQNFLKFLDTICETKDENGNEIVSKIDGRLEKDRKKDLIQEMMGYLLLRKYKYHNAFLLYSSGRSGKSTLVEINEKMLGKDNVSHVGLSDITKDKFSSFELYHKLANFGGEISNNDEIRDSREFKTLTGADTHRARPIYRQGFDFESYAKMIFTGNSVPKTYDSSEAFYSRWIIITFDRYLKLEERIGDYANVITTPEELSGLFNWALEGLDRLEKNQGRFTYDRFIHVPQGEGREITLEKYDYYATLQDAFIRECCKFGSELKIPVYKMEQSYNSWLLKGGHNFAPSDRKLNEVILRYNVTKERPRGDYNTIWYYQGIDIKERIAKREAKKKARENADNKEGSAQNIIDEWEEQLEDEVKH